MTDKNREPLPVDPTDGTKVYTPVGERFSAAAEIGGVKFREDSEAKQ